MFALTFKEENISDVYNSELLLVNRLIKQVKKNLFEKYVAATRCFQQSFLVPRWKLVGRKNTNLRAVNIPLHSVASATLNWPQPESMQMRNISQPGSWQALEAVWWTGINWACLGHSMVRAGRESHTCPCSMVHPKSKDRPSLTERPSIHSFWSYRLTEEERKHSCFGLDKCHAISLKLGRWTAHRLNYCLIVCNKERCLVAFKSDSETESVRYESGTLKRRTSHCWVKD